MSHQQLRSPAPLGALLAGADGGVPRRFLTGAEGKQLLISRENSHRSGKWMKIMENDGT